MGSVVLTPSTNSVDSNFGLTVFSFTPQVKMKFLVVLSVVAVAMAQEQPANFACPNYPFCAIAPAAVAAPAAYQPHMDLYWAQRQALYQPVVDYSLPGMDQWYAAQAAQEARMGLHPGNAIHQAQIARVEQEQARLIAYAAQGY